MWDYLVKKIRPGNASRSLERTAAARGPVDSQSVEPADKHPATEPVRGRNRRLLCPACSGAMRVETVGGVEIDRCSNCGGIFLDQGELEVLTHDEYGGGENPGASTSEASRTGGRTSGPARNKPGSVLIYTPTGLRAD